MDYSDFVKNYNERKLIVHVDHSQVFEVMRTHYMPRGVKISHTIWCWITFLSVPLGLFCMFYYAWWVGLLMLFFLTPALWQGGVKKTACQNVIMEALDNQEFYGKAVDRGLLIIRKK